MGDVGSGRALRLNGEPIHIASSTENLSVDEILDRAQNRCVVDSAGLGAHADSWFSRDGTHRLPAEVTPLAAAGVLRERHGDSGVVACLARQPGSSAGDLTEPSTDFLH